MDKDQFKNLVQQAVEALPLKIRQKMENIAIVVEDNPSFEQLRKVGVRYGSLLLGLYEGIPQTKWGKGFGMVLPDKITIFQQSIENIAHSKKEIKELVKYVVWHEIGHHFGFDEKKIKELEKKWKKED